MALSTPVEEIVSQSSDPLLSKHDSWGRVQLAELAEVLNGFAFKSSQFNKERGTPLIRIRDVGKDSTDVLYDGSYEEQYEIEAGDLLIGMDGDFNSARWKGSKALLNQRVCKVELVSDHYSDGFLKYVLPGYLKAINDKTSAVTVKHLSSKSVKEIPLPLPPLNEQRRIVAKIEELFTRLDAGVRSLKQTQALLKNYRRSVLKAAVEGELSREWREAHKDELEPASELLERILHERREMFTGKKYKEPASPDTSELPGLPVGWTWASPPQLASPEQYSLGIGPFGSNLKVEDYADAGVPLVFVRNIRSGSFDEVGKRYVTQKKAEVLTAHSVHGGDVLITKMGDPPGDACLYPDNLPTAILTADCIKWRLSTLLTSRQLFVHFINSPTVHHQILRRTRGVAQLKVSLGRFSEIGVPLPPLEEQRIIVEEVERRLSVVDKLEATVEANVKQADTLRQSILKRAFSGELVPQDQDDEPASVLLERIRQDRETTKPKGRKKNARVRKNYPLTVDSPRLFPEQGA